MWFFYRILTLTVPTKTRLESTFCKKKVHPHFIHMIAFLQANYEEPTVMETSSTGKTSYDRVLRILTIDYANNRLADYSNYKIMTPLYAYIQLQARRRTTMNQKARRRMTMTETQGMDTKAATMNMERWPICKRKLPNSARRLKRTSKRKLKRRRPYLKQPHQNYHPPGHSSPLPQHQAWGLHACSQR